MNLPDILKNEQVNELVTIGRAYYENFCNNPKFFLVADGDLYKKGKSYHIVKRGYEEHKRKIMNSLK